MSHSIRNEKRSNLFLSVLRQNDSKQQRKCVSSLIVPLFVSELTLLKNPFLSVLTALNFIRYEYNLIIGRDRVVKLGDMKDDDEKQTMKGAEIDIEGQKLLTENGFYKLLTRRACNMSCMM